MPGHPGTPGMRARISGHSRPDSTVSDIILTVCLQPSRGAVVTLIFTWRVIQRLSVPTIAWLLNRDPAAYPPPGDGPGWTETRVAAILRNPKYTGHMVYGRTCKLPAPRKPRPVPPQEWIWSAEPRCRPTCAASWTR